MSLCQRQCLTLVAPALNGAHLAHVKGRRPVTPSGGASAVPAGRGSSPLLPGGIGHHACRHHDRHARCSLKPGPAPAGDPCHPWRCAPRSLVRSRVLGMRESRGREPLWNAGRRARSAERAPRLKTRCWTAPFGVLLPFSFRSFFHAPRPIVMLPARHCRIYLTKIGLAARFLAWLRQNSGANKKRVARTRLLCHLAPRAGRGRIAEQSG
jgi:hypothetical protein